MDSILLTEIFLNLISKVFGKLQSELPPVMASPEETLVGLDDVTLRGGKKCEEIDTVEMLNV